MAMSSETRSLPTVRRNDACIRVGVFLALFAPAYYCVHEAFLQVRASSPMVREADTFVYPRDKKVSFDIVNKGHVVRRCLVLEGIAKSQVLSVTCTNSAVSASVALDSTDSRASVALTLDSNRAPAGEAQGKIMLSLEDNRRIEVPLIAIIVEKQSGCCGS